jgi:cytochrome c oxidase accessory protein FixG
LLKNLLDLNVGWSVSGWILGIASATYIMAGFAREQVCNFMCPYARFQSAMFDQDTLIVSYDKNRGEERGKHKQGESFEKRGHCIDCKQCVVVCPQDIDIRNGLQMECIACGLCVDACDNVMQKIGLPKGLIRYDTENNLEKKIKFRILRPKTFYYGLILLIIGGFIVFNLSVKLPLKIDILHDRNPIFVMLSNGNVSNGYIIKISNKTFENKSYNLKIRGIDHYSIKLVGGGMNILNLPVLAQEVASFKVYIAVDSDELLNHHKNIDFIVTDNQSDNFSQRTSVFISQ